MSSIITKSAAQQVGYNSLTNEAHFNGGTLGDSNVDMTFGTNYTTIVKALETFISSIPDSVKASITENPKAIVTVKNVDGTSQTYDVNTTNYTVTIPVADIKSGKNTFTIEASLPAAFLDLEIPDSYRPSQITIPTVTFDVYKGTYTHSGTSTGKTNYTFTVNAEGTTAPDMMVAIDNNNEITTTNDDEMIMLLPDSSGDIRVTNLKSTGGHNIRSQNYEEWVVAASNSSKGGQDVSMTYNIDLRKIADTSTEIKGTFLKIDDTTGNSPAPFAMTDTKVWLHVHYTHPSATYTATCATGADASLCTGVNESDSIWIGATVMSIDSVPTSSNTSYSFTDGSYSIKGLAGHNDYKMLVFWMAKNIEGTNYPVGTVTSGSVEIGMDITLDGRSKELTGTLNTTDTRIRIARKVTFHAQPFELFSDIVTKDDSKQYTLNYAYDVTGKTKTYLLWGGNSDAIDTIPATCDDTNKCREIIISATTPSTTDLTIN